MGRGDYEALFEITGKSETTTIEDSLNFDPRRTGAGRRPCFGRM